MQNWYPLIYGKITESPEGPILVGKDHECTGKSPSIPRFVYEQCEPKIIGPGVNDLTPWGEYTWLDDGGGIAVQPVSNGNDVWVVVARVRGRSESGENKSGRYYMQGTYLTLPAAEFSPLVLSNLSEIQTLPMQEKDMDLQPQKLDCADGPLEQDWIDKCEMIFETLMGGETLSIQASKRSVPEMGRLFQHVLCALPKTLAWRLGIRFGSYEMNQDVALAHGQRALGGVRMMGYSDSDFQKNRQKTGGYEILPQWIEEADRRGERFLSEGARYVQFLRDNTSECRTFSDLLGVVKAQFPELSEWDSAPLEMTWSDLALECTARLFEQDAMALVDNYLDGSNSEVPSLENCCYFRTKILMNLLEKPLSLVAPLLSHTIASTEDSPSIRYPSWPESWNTSVGANPNFVAISALFRDSHALTMESMAYAQSISELPPMLSEYAFRSLRAQLNDDFLTKSASPYWALLFEGEQTPDWLLKWRDENASSLFWLSVRVRRTANDDSLMLAGALHPSWQFLAQLKSESAINESQGQEWCRALPKDSDALLDFNAVVDEVMPINVAHGLQMFGWSDLELPLKKILEGNALYTWSAGPSTAFDIAQRVANGLKLNPLLLRVLLAFSDDVSQDIVDSVLKAVSTGCNHFYQSAYFGRITTQNGDNPEWNAVAHQVAIERFMFDKNFPAKLYAVLSSDGLDTHQSAIELRSAIQRHLGEEEIEPPSDQLAQVLYHLLRSAAAPAIADTETASLAWLLTDIKLSNASELVAGLNGFRALLNLKPKKLALTGARLLDILASPETLEEFRMVASTNNWQESPVWRFLFFELNSPEEIIVKPTNEEQFAIDRQDPEAWLQHVFAGVVIRDSQLSRVSQMVTTEGYNALVNKTKSIAHLHVLASIAAHTSAVDYKSQIAHISFEMASQAGEFDALLSDYVLPPPWYKKAVGYINFLSKKVEQSLSSKLNLKCETVADAVDAFFVAEGRDQLQRYRTSFKPSS